jgi:mono/diheme cytochrome c family protein
MTVLRLGLTVAALVVLGGSAARAAERPVSDMAIAGKRVAQRNCGVCHAVGAGASTAPDAPPFRNLHKRYRSGGLPQLLREGMLQPTTPPDEGSPPRHPLMPMAVLGDDEVAELTAYLKPFEAAPPARRHHRRR